jgi:carbohydrate diacid regulator
MEREHMLKKIAPKIALSINEITGYEVMITDENAIIIGASDATRLGTCHEASLRIIATGKPNHELYYQQVKGSKPGIALPIELAGKIVGTIGLAGDRKEVEKFGLLAKRHAEIMLCEEKFLKTTLLREQALQNLIREITVFDAKNNKELLLITRGYELGYDLKPPHIAIVFDLFQFKGHIKKLNFLKSKENSLELTIQSLKLDILNKIKLVFKNPNDIVTPLEKDKFIVLHCLEYNFNSEKSREDIYRKCNEVMEKLKEDGVMVSIGIGSIAQNITGLSKSYKDAWQALEIGKKLCDTPKIHISDEYRIETLLINIKSEASGIFMINTLNKLKSEADWSVLFETIRVWCESGFNQLEASKRLYIHRNTLSQRLNKISRIIDIDIKDFKNILALYLAILITELTQ